MSSGLEQCVGLVLVVALVKLSTWEPFLRGYVLMNMSFSDYMIAVCSKEKVYTCWLRIVVAYVHGTELREKIVLRAVGSWYQ